MWRVALCASFWVYLSLSHLIYNNEYPNRFDLTLWRLPVSLCDSLILLPSIITWIFSSLVSTQSKCQPDSYKIVSIGICVTVANYTLAYGSNFTSEYFRVGALILSLFSVIFSVNFKKGYKIKGQSRFQTDCHHVISCFIVGVMALIPNIYDKSIINSEFSLKGVACYVVFISVLCWIFRELRKLITQNQETTKNEGMFYNFSKWKAVAAMSYSLFSFQMRELVHFIYYHPSCLSHFFLLGIAEALLLYFSFKCFERNIEQSIILFYATYITWSYWQNYFVIIFSGLILLQLTQYFGNKYYESRRQIRRAEQMKYSKLRKVETTQITQIIE